MIFKLNSIVRSIVPPDRFSLIEEEQHSLIQGFMNLYKQYGVKVIGTWWGIDRRNNYYMTAYRDEDHYLEFVQAMKQNKEYQRLSKEIKRFRESTTSETLEIIQRYSTYIDLVDYNEYIKEAKKILSET